MKKWVAALAVVLSSLLWRIRGGLKVFGEKLPANKIWFPLAFAAYGCCYFSWEFRLFLVGFADSYTAEQIFGWGPYIGGLMSGKPFDRKVDAENELIDDLLYPCRITFSEKSAKIFNKLFGWMGLEVEAKTYWLKDYGHVFGFCGTCLTGLIMSFLWGLFLHSGWVMISGLMMGPCYLLGYYLNKLIPEKKAGWGYGEWIFGAWCGIVFVWLFVEKYGWL